MASGRIIADSDDEDGDLDGFSPPGPNRTLQLRPEIEPLSPQHRPLSPVAQQSSDLTGSVLNEHNHTSGSTDLSFFINVYDDQQNKALRQSHLLETIVRLSQKASASSGEVSLPTNRKGRTDIVSVSSATDITSPPVDSRSGPKKTQLGQISNATELTTPRKSSSKDEWDVPSSGEESAMPKNIKGHEGKSLKISKKRKRSNSGLVPNNLASGEMIERIGPSLQPATNKRSCRDPFLEESIIPETGNFYVAPSILTTSQKLQYQRVKPLENQGLATEATNAGVMLPPSNHKSSGVSTIPYSTPSRYASSGPRPPWETGQSALLQNENTQNIVDLTSSPDEIASGHSPLRRQKITSTSKIDTTLVEDELIPTPKYSTKNKRSKSKDDVDELGQDSIWDFDNIGRPRERYKPRISRRRSLNESRHDIQAEVYPDVDVVTEEPVSDFDPEHGEVTTILKTKQTAKNNKPPSTTQDVAQPKRRGRKKKQPVSEESIIDEEVIKQTSNIADFNAPSPVPKMDSAAEIPKKKRGRPRKPKDAKTEDTISRPVAMETASISQTLAEPASAKEIPAQMNIDTIADTRKELATQMSSEANKEDVEREVEIETQSSVSPLKEVDRNSILTSQPTVSNSEKSTGVSIIKPTLSQAGKTLYRVGLSKRSRIAPLLKSLKK